MFIVPRILEQILPKTGGSASSLVASRDMPIVAVDARWWGERVGVETIVLDRGRSTELAGEICPQTKKWRSLINNERH
jgi:hypothetical protein